MFAKNLKYNLKLMLSQKTFWFVFGLLLLIGIAIPVYHVIAFWGAYRYELPSADTLYMASGEGNWWGAIALLFPFLIVLPYSFSYLEESKSGVILYVQSRGGRKEYYYSQMLTCLIGTAVAFFIPLLCNIALNAILFPVNGNDYTSTYNRYDLNWLYFIMGENFSHDTLFKGCLFPSFAISHPQLYNVAYAFWMAAAAGIMGMFAYAVSVALQKGVVTLLIADVIFFNIFTVLDRLIYERGPVYINTYLQAYLASGLFEDGRVYPLYLLFLAALAAGSVLIIRNRIRKDEVS